MKLNNDFHLEARKSRYYYLNHFLCRPTLWLVDAVLHSLFIIRGGVRPVW